LLLAAGLALFFSGGLDYVSLQSLAEHRDGLRAWVAENFAVALLSYAALYASAVALSLPAAAILTLTGGFLFGWIFGGTTAVLAATMGATAIFLLARSALGGTLSRRAGPWLSKLRAGFQEDAISYLLFLRLVPAFPFWLVNLAPALLGMKLRDYVIATFFGIIPSTFAISVIGSGLDSVLATQHQAYLNCLARQQPPSNPPCQFDIAPSAFVTPQLLAALVLLGVVAILPVIVKRLWKSKAGRA